MPSIDRFAPALFALLRVIAGLLFLEHGLVKLFGFPAGSAPGLQPVVSFLGLAALIEVGAGGLIALGLFGRIAAFIASGEMAVGYFMVHAPKSFYPAVNGGDAAILFCFFFLYMAAAGSGAFSLDRLFARRGVDTSLDAPTRVRA